MVDKEPLSGCVTSKLLLWLWWWCLLLTFFTHALVSFYAFLKYKNITQNSENKPRGLYFSKVRFEGLIFGGAYIRRGWSTEGNLHLKIDWASLIVGRKSTIFALFYFVYEGSFPISSPQGAYIWRGNLPESFLCYRFEGLIHGGTYFRNFTVF